MRAHTLALVGVQNAEPAQLDAAAAAGLASFAPSATTPIRRPTRAAPDFGARRRAARQPRARPAAARVTTRIVTEPVRSGTQIYARGGDLIVTAAVSPGAELMADGNIHVYGRAARPGPGRRRAATPAARIFCTRLEAELVSIAGRYLVSEQLPAGTSGRRGADRAGRRPADDHPKLTSDPDQDRECT